MRVIGDSAVDALCSRGERERELAGSDINPQPTPFCKGQHLGARHDCGQNCDHDQT